jgi:hypothetical protein
MGSKAETFERHAEACRRRADATFDGELEALWRGLSSQWTELAETTRRLEADRTVAEESWITIRASRLPGGG